MSAEDVLQALTLACSQDPSVLKLGEAQLESWKREKGFYSTIASIFANRELGTAVRWMAITYLKNGIEQFWRVGATFAIASRERPLIKAAIIQCWEDPVPQIGNQIAVLTARIARLDCPEDWPELIPLLTEGIRSSSDFTRKCYLNVFKHVIKTLAGRRLSNARKVFTDLTTSLFVYIVGLWNTHLQGGVAVLSAGDADSAISTLEMGQVCLKILRQMIVHGMAKFHAIVEAIQFISTLIERIPALLQLRSQLSQEHPTKDVIEKNINLMMKILIEVQSHQALGYAQFLTASLEMIRDIIFNPENQNKLYEKLVISCFNLLRSIIRCEDYNPPKPELAHSVLPPGVMEGHVAKLNFFRAGSCELILQRLITYYMPMTDEEIDELENNTEEYMQERAGETNLYSLRESIESALIGMLHEYQSTLCPALIEMIQAVQGTDHTASDQAIRLKEAVYKAAGQGAFQLYDDLDFDKWYQGQLLQELSITDPRYRIVRHRVVWLIGSWVTVKLSSEFRPSVYSLMVPLLAQSESLPIRLAASDVIRICADDFDFMVDDFNPFLADATSNLFQLLLDVQTPDTKMKVLNTLSLLLERMGGSIQPHISSLLQYLPQLWLESAQENCSMLRCIIITTLNNIVKGLGSLSPNLHGFIIPVLQLATNVKEAEHVHLAEDGLELWLTTLHNATAVSSELLGLFSNLVGVLGIGPPSDESSLSMAGLMDIGSDSLQVCFKIMSGYVVLCASQPDLFLQSCAEVVIRGCQYYFCDVKPEGVVAITTVLADMARVFPKHIPQLIQPLLPTVLRKLLDEPDYPPTTAVFLDLIGRILVSDTMFFFSFLEKMATETQQTAAGLLGLIIEEWSDRLDSVSNVKHRKLTGLAIANLLPMKEECVMQRFGLMVNMCVEVLHDVMETTDEGALIDSLVNGKPQENGDIITPTEHDQREKQLSQFDPVTYLPLNKHVTAKLQETLSIYDHQGYTALMTGVDPSVREQLFEFIPTDLAGTLLALNI